MAKGARAQKTLGCPTSIRSRNSKGSAKSWAPRSCAFLFLRMSGNLAQMPRSEATMRFARHPHLAAKRRGHEETVLLHQLR